MVLLKQTTRERVTMSKANKIQHGGAHYRSKFQHWDLVHCLGLNYYAGCASKYVSRHWKKNGREDLEKAGHFIQKWVELIEENLIEPPPFVMNQKSPSTLEAFLNANLTLPESSLERHILVRICRPRHLLDLREAIDLIHSLIDVRYPSDESPREEYVLNIQANPHVDDAPVVDSCGGSAAGAGVEVGSTVGWGSPTQDFYPEGFLGVGGRNGRDMYQCKHCNEHISVPGNTHPLSYHNCTNRPLYVEDQDSGVPGPGYVNQ